MCVDGLIGFPKGVPDSSSQTVIFSSWSRCAWIFQPVDPVDPVVEICGKSYICVVYMIVYTRYLYLLLYDIISYNYVNIFIYTHN